MSMANEFIPAMVNTCKGAFSVVRAIPKVCSFFARARLHWIVMGFCFFAIPGTNNINIPLLIICYPLGFLCFFLFFEALKQKRKRKLDPDYESRIFQFLNFKNWKIGNAPISFPLNFSKKGNSSKKSFINLGSDYEGDALIKEECEGVAFFGSIGTGKYKRYIAKDLFNENTDGTGAGMMLFGGSGSGKSTCVTIPSLLLSKKGEHIVCIDVKGEMQREYRKKFKNRKIISWSPDTNESWNYNPLAELDEKRDDVRGTASAIASALVPLSGNPQSAYFEQSAQNFLTGAIIYYHFNPELEYSFGELIKVINSKTLNQMLTEFRNCEVDFAEKEVVNELMTQFYDMKDTEAGSIFSSLKNAIGSFTNAKLVKIFGNKNADEDKTFTAESIKDYDVIFIQVNDSDLSSRYASAVGIIVGQICDVILRRNENEKEPIFLLLDEAPSYLSNINTSPNGNEKSKGKIEKIFQLGRSLHSYCLIACQSLVDVENAIGKNKSKSLIDSASIMIVLGVTEPESQEYFSRKLGDFFERDISQSENFESLLDMKESGSTQRRIQTRRVVAPSKFASLQKLPTQYDFINTKTGKRQGFGKAILFYPSLEGAVMIDKIPYFKNRYNNDWQDEVFKMELY